jgi:5-(carboxyamino)imidazole ribonucleotide mutase
MQPAIVQYVTSPLIGVVMGSSSDWDTMQHAVHILQQFGVAHEARVVSAHRMPDDMFAYAEAAEPRGLRAIIAGAGGAAPARHAGGQDRGAGAGRAGGQRHLQGVDSLHSIVQMPKGVPVATFAIGTAGAANAALFAVALLAATTRRCASGCTPSAPSRPRRRAP